MFVNAYNYYSLNPYTKSLLGGLGVRANAPKDGLAYTNLRITVKVTH